VRNKIITVLLGITLSIIMLFGLLPACGGGGTGPQPTGGATATSGGGGGGPAPTAQGKTYNWRYQSNANAGTATYWISEENVANLARATGNRMIWELAPQGAIVGTMEIFDAVATKAIEVGTGCD
jgi:TRAP-type mannitol/chloroaromatic compound transport system substrate-binding protein